MEQPKDSATIKEMYGKREHLQFQLNDVIPGTPTHKAMSSLIEEYSRSIDLKENNSSSPDYACVDENGNGLLGCDGAGQDSSQSASVNGTQAKIKIMKPTLLSESNSPATPAPVTSGAAGLSDSEKAANRALVTNTIAVVVIIIMILAFFQFRGGHKHEGGDKDEVYKRYLEHELA